MLARITVLKTDSAQYIILCFHHIIGDGSSGIDYLLQIMHFYNYPNPLNVVEPQDEIKKLIQPIPKPRVLALQACLTIAKTKIKGIHITNDLINSIENKAKIEGGTLNGYLSALILESASQVFNIDEFNVSMSVDLRRKNSSRTVRSLKFHTSWIDFVREKSDTSKIVQSKIRDRFRNKQHIKNLIDLSDTVDQRDNDADFAKLFIASQPTICVGNNSKVSNSDNENSTLKLTELHSSVNCQAYIGARHSCTIQLCQLSQQGLSINVNYVDTLMDEKEINFFISCLEEKLER